MAERVIGVFEIVQIQKKHGNRSVLAAGQRNRLADPIVEQEAIRQTGNSVVLSVVGHFKRHRASRAHIVKNDNSSNDTAFPVGYRRGGSFNRAFKSVAPNKNTIRSESDGTVLLNRHFHRISSSFARSAVNDLEDFAKRLTSSVFALPASQLFRHEIEIRNVSGNIRTENGIANGIEGDQGAFFFQIQRIFHHFSFNRVVQRARE